jgi:hypothetical protein
MEKKPLNAGKKLMLTITILAVGLLLLYIGAGIAAKASIRDGLEEMTAQLQAQTGAENVKVQIFGAPGDSDAPFTEQFHVYLTVQLKDMSQFTESDALRVLRNSDEVTAKYNVDYGYDWNDLDYAVYTRTVKDYVGVEHPVFVTITDGKSYYSLERGYKALTIGRFNAVARLNPPIISMVTVMVAVFAAAIVFLDYFVFKHEREYRKWYKERDRLIDEEVRKVREARKKKK